jgi:fused signal recognition particle receptor
LPQVKQFNEAVEMDGLICTKLDASAKGGALLSIAHHTQIPTIYVTAGESVEALHLFEAESYLNSLI